MPRIHPLLAQLRRSMQAAADPKRAAGQQAYMKSAMPYHGVRSSEMRAICRDVFRDYPFDDAARWQKDVLAIWRGAAFREERYAAIELAQARKARRFHVMESLPTFEELIVDGAWWDYVDTIASHDLGLVLKNEGAPMRRAMLAWSKCDDIWKRRSAILCQLHLREETDLDLLYACIEPSISSKEFFLRKAIGWALRQYAWTDPDEVVRWVRANEHRLSNLSKREALKNIEVAAERARAGSARRTAATSSPARAARRRTA